MDKIREQLKQLNRDLLITITEEGYLAWIIPTGFIYDDLTYKSAECEANYFEDLLNDIQAIISIGKFKIPDGGW